jgi:hypothetical protein
MNNIKYRHKATGKIVVVKSIQPRWGYRGKKPTPRVADNAMLKAGFVRAG